MTDNRTVKYIINHIDLTDWMTTRNIIDAISEKHDIEMLSKASSHDLAPEPGVENYYDTAFPVTAIETTKDFVSLEEGWNYADKQSFDFKTAIPEAETQGPDENATDFEKQGFGRQMLR